MIKLLSSLALLLCLTAGQAFAQGAGASIGASNPSYPAPTCFPTIAATTDIGLTCQPGALVALQAGSGPVTSLGNTAPAGTFYDIYAPGTSVTFTNGTDLIVPGDSTALKYTLPNVSPAPKLRATVLTNSGTAVWKLENLSNPGPTCTLGDAATVDVGSVCSPGAVLTITGTGTAITSLGDSAPVGTFYILRVNGNTVTFTGNSTNLVAPSASGAYQLASTSPATGILAVVTGTDGTGPPAHNIWYLSNPILGGSLVCSNGSCSTGGNLGAGTNLQMTGAASSFTGVSNHVIDNNALPGTLTNWGTTPAIVGGNGTFAFRITTGASGTPANPLQFTMPVAAANFWACDGQDLTTPTTTIRQISNASTTVVQFNSYNTVLVATPLPNSETVQFKCTGY